jgi:hypothetical protein
MRILRIRIPNTGFGQGQIDPAWKPHRVKERLKPRGILIYLSGQGERLGQRIKYIRLNLEITPG